MHDPNKKRYIYFMLAGFGAISMSIILFFLLYRLKGIGEFIDSITQIVLPFIYGGVVAYLLRPMCNAFEALFISRLPGKYRARASSLALAASFLTVFIIIYTLVAMIVPRLYDSLVTLSTAVPFRLQRFIAWAQESFGMDERVSTLLDSFNTSYEALYREAESYIRDTIVPQITTFVSGLGSSVYRVLKVLYNLLIGLIVAVYVLSNRKRFAHQGKLVINSIFSQKIASVILDEVAFVDRMFGGFIDAKILDSAIVGLLCYVCCSIMHIPNVLLISVFVGVTNIIPFFGPFIGAVPSTLLILIEDPIRAVWFIVFVLILQQIDGNLIGPKIMGNRIGISGFWVMFAIIFFGGIWGLAGMIIGVPLFAVIYDLVRKFVKSGLDKQNKMEMWEEYVARYPNEDIPTVHISENEKNIKDWTVEDWKTESLLFVRNVLRDLKNFWQLLLVYWAKVWAVLVHVGGIVSGYLSTGCRVTRDFCVRTWKLLRELYGKMATAFSERRRKK